MNSYDDILTNAAPAKQAFDENNFNVDAWKEKKQAERQAVYELADSTAANLAGNGERFQAYLDVQARFDRYSATNVMLILAQMPDAAPPLRDFDGWKERGVSIRKNQKAISILEPGEEYTCEDGSVGVSYNVKKVFALSQTDSKETQRPAAVDERQLLKALIHNPPAAIRSSDELPKGMGALYQPERNEILVRRGMAFEDIFHSVAQELAHAQFAEKDKAYSRGAYGFPAYCVSYLLSKKHSVSVAGYDFSSLPESLRGMEPQEIRAELSEIRDAAAAVNGRMARAQEAAKVPKSREAER